MNTPTVPQPPRQPAQLRAGPTGEMTACRIAGLALGAVVLGLVLSQVPDIIRYVRMTQM